MASTFNKFNAFSAYPFNGAVNLASDTIKIMLTNTVPIASNSVYGDISGTELSGSSGYTTGGNSCAIVSSIQASGTYKYIATSPATWTAGGTWNAFRYSVIYDSSAATKVLIGWWDYSSSLVLTVGQTFQVALDPTNGVFQNS